MAASDKLTLSQLRTAVRLKLADPNARWWSNEQLNLYINNWHDEVNNELHCNWGTATATFTSQFTPFGNIASDLTRVFSIRKNSQVNEIPYISVYRLNEINREFRWVTGPNPGAWYDEEGKLGIFPIPSAPVAMEVEYEFSPILTADSNPMRIPAWTKYSVIPHVCSQAYGQLGPNFDHTKSMRYRARYEWWNLKFRSVGNKWMAARALSLKPDSGYNESRRQKAKHPFADSEIVMPSVSIIQNAPYVEVPAGDIDGLNTTFTLTRAPEALILFMNNSVLMPGVHFTLTGSTIAIDPTYVPSIGWSLIAYYWVAG